MIKSKKYDTPEAFRAGLEARIQKVRNENESLELIRRKISFEAFLLRIKPSGCQVILKGGFALHLRYDVGVRPTKDLDTAMYISDVSNLKPAQIEQTMRRTLESIAIVYRDDFFSFTIGESMADLGLGREFVGFRFSVRARIGSRSYDSFHIDMTTGDAMLSPFDSIPIGMSFEFAGLSGGEVLTIRVGQHFAEKLHAYCRDRSGKKNSRVKDLFDIVLFIDQGVVAEQVAAVIEDVFRLCGNTPIPKSLMAPPESWIRPYEEMAKENGLQSSNLDVAFEKVSKFYNEILKIIR